MTKDPVCGKQVNENKAPATSSYQSKKYSFCGQECKDKFDQQPENYVPTSQQPNKQEEHAHR
jgi:Cu+-exporting ATPase